MDFAKRYPECSTALDAWYRIVKHTKFGNIAELRGVFPNADQVGGFTVFNIGGTRSGLFRLSITTHSSCISGMSSRITNMTKTNGGKADVTGDKRHYPDLAGY